MAAPDIADRLQRLVTRLEALLQLTERLAEENRQMRAQQEIWLAERAQLLAKNDQARTRVEAMIQRLRALEQSP